MTIQKKSLISALNTTKKAIVASTPVAPASTSETRLSARKAGRKAGRAASRAASRAAGRAAGRSSRM